MNRCSCSTEIAHDHFIATCKRCGNIYDVDFSPPLFCHDGDGDWDIEVVQFKGMGKKRESSISHTDFSAI